MSESKTKCVDTSSMLRVWASSARGEDSKKRVRHFHLAGIEWTFLLHDFFHDNGGLAEELGTTLQKLLRGCEALTHLQSP